MSGPSSSPPGRHRPVTSSSAVQALTALIHSRLFQILGRLLVLAGLIVAAIILL